MKIYYTEYNIDWEIKDIDITCVKYCTYHKYHNELNKVYLGKWIGDKFYNTEIRSDKFFRTKEDAQNYINKTDDNSYTLQELLYMYKIMESIL